MKPNALAGQSWPNDPPTDVDALRDEIDTLGHMVEKLSAQLKAAREIIDEQRTRICDLDSNEPWPYYDLHLLDSDGSDELHDSIPGRDVLGFLREHVGVWEVTESASGGWLFYDTHGQDNQGNHNKCASLAAGADVYGTAVEMQCWDGVEELNT